MHFFCFPLFVPFLSTSIVCRARFDDVHLQREAFNLKFTFVSWLIKLKGNSRVQIGSWFFYAPKDNN